MAVIVGFELHDVRFPTSVDLEGSDAMNPDPDYSAAYVIVNWSDGVAGHGFVFTIGRGNDVELAAIRALEPLCVGRELPDGIAGVAELARVLVGESQLRWLGPEKGVIHMAIGAVVNAAFDAAARREGQPLWRYLAQLAPEELLAVVDFRYLSDALTPAEALELLRRREAGKHERIAALEDSGYPAYTTGPGWLGYRDDKMVRLCRQAVDEGFELVKLKVGRSLDDDLRRCALAREAVGDGVGLAVDANQVWDVDAAVDWVRALGRFDLAWVEEPTSPDDVLGLARIRRGVAPVPVAAGEHVPNRVVFKQMLQAGALDILQIDATRVGGVSENIAILLLAAKFGVPVCPHAGGVGLCEAVQHLAFLDYAAISGSLDDRRIEWVDDLHQHFAAPAAVSHGRYLAPKQPGSSSELVPESLARYTYPEGPAWRRT